MNAPTPREDELLRLILHWQTLHTDDELALQRQWLGERLCVSTTRLSDLKKGLVLKGFLEKNRNRFSLTRVAIAYLNTASNSSLRVITPTYLPMLGQVRAGKAKQDELRVDLVDPSYPENATMIPIPDLEEGTEAFVLEVTGTSMEHERIYEGDYVIVQPYRHNKMPSQRDLIVTYYLPPRNESEVEDIVDMDDIWFDGPTLKYFTELPGNSRPYRLSWKRDIQSSAYTIETKRIKPLGKVVGVYRPFRK